jgi:hypothetical protein
VVYRRATFFLGLGSFLISFNNKRGFLPATQFDVVESKDSAPIAIFPIVVSFTTFAYIIRFYNLQKRVITGQMEWGGSSL